MRKRNAGNGRLIAYFCLAVLFGALAGLLVSSDSASRDMVSRRQNALQEQAVFSESLPLQREILSDADPGLNASEYSSSAKEFSPVSFARPNFDSITPSLFAVVRGGGALLTRVGGISSVVSDVPFAGEILSFAGMSSREIAERSVQSVARTFDRALTADIELGESKNVRRHVIRAGDTLATVLGDEGVECDVSAAIAREMAKFSQGRDLLRKGEVLEVRFGSDSRFSEVRRRKMDGTQLVVSRDALGGYASRVVAPQVKDSVRSVGGNITRSLAGSAEELDIPYDIVDDLVDLLSSRVTFHKDLQPGDRFAVVYHERRLEDGTLIEAGPIEAALLILGGEAKGVIRQVGAGGKDRYYDEKGQSLGDSFLRYPVQFSRISSVFSKARFHPVLNINRPHNGVDFAAPSGTPVRTIGNGKVLFSGYSKSAGFTVKIQHNERYSTEYMHLSKIDRAVREGCTVTRGQLIGAVGSTGLSSGPHLHFGLFEYGEYRDPLTVDFGSFEGNQEKLSPAIVKVSLDSLHQVLEGVAPVILAQRGGDRTRPQA